VAAEHDDAVWVTESQQYSLAELVTLSGLPETELRELVDYGALRPANPEGPSWVFSGQCLLSVRAAYRIRASFELEPHGLALVVSLLERIRELEARLGHLDAQQPRGPRD
jgi:chaperone modulatory protein CbpM